jgi:endonuclease III
MELKEFVKIYGKKYSEILGIEPDNEPFKWFLASLLFGAPIREENAIKTYKIFEKNGYTSPEKIIMAGWDEIVKCLDEGGYTRYDFKTADKIIEACKNIVKIGGIEKLKEKSNLKDSLKNLAKGIGDVTVNIFLRELPWAEHSISEYAIISAEKHHLFFDKKFKKIEGMNEIEMEIAFMKLGRDFCRKGKCNKCPFPC